MQKLDARAMALAVGILWSALIFLSAFMAMFGWAVGLVDVMGGLYIGYQATFIGAIIGAVWAFIDGYVGGLIVVWLYNKFAK
jgi:hypothetical protein